MIDQLLTGYNAAKAAADLETELLKEIALLSEMVKQTAASNIRYYPEVRDHLERHLVVLANRAIEGEITADYWQAWLEQFGKGSKMAGPDQNPGLDRYMNSEMWNSLRSWSSRVVVGRGKGKYKSISGKVLESGGGYAGVDLEELAERGDIDPRFKATPPTFFLRVALHSNKNRILQGISNVITNFPYHNYFTRR